MAQTAQSLNDRLNAVRYGLAGQGLAKSVCKATTEEPRGPKKKHLDYLLHCTEEPNVSIPALANFLIERVQNTNWTVVFKALTTIHHLMLYGNERFVQYFASANVNLVDACNAGQQGRMAAPGFGGGDLSNYTRKYANYLNQKALSYRMVAFDFCRAKRGRDEGILRKMNADQILRCLPIVQRQMDALLEFEITANECSNSVVSGCFILLFRDLIRLFACYNDGIINLLEKYFEMNRKQCKEALEIYRRFLTRMDRVSEFLKVAENVGIPRGEIPDLTRAPSSLLEALEQHLNALEGNKGGGASGGGGGSSAMTSPSSGGGGLNPSASVHAGLTNFAKTEASIGNVVGEAEKQRILLEEEEAMRRMKEGAVRRLSGTNGTVGGGGGGGGAASSNFSNTSSPQRQQQQQQQQQQPKKEDFDFFGTNSSGGNNFDAFAGNNNNNSSRTQQTQQQQQQTKLDIDLLLGDADLSAANNNNNNNNNFSNMSGGFGGGGGGMTGNNNNFQHQQQQQQQQQQQFANFASFPQQQQQQNNFQQQTSQYANGGGGVAAAAATNNNNNLFDPFGGNSVLQPTNVMSPSTSNANANANALSNNTYGSNNNLQNASATGKQPPLVQAGNLDESLKNLVQNLNLTGGGSVYGGRGAMSPTTASPKKSMNATMGQQQQQPVQFQQQQSATYQQAAAAAAAPGRPPPPGRPAPPQNPFT